MNRLSLDRLSRKQREIMRLAVRGLTNTQISERIGVAEASVKSQLTTAMERLGVSCRMQAARLFEGSGDD